MSFASLPLILFFSFLSSAKEPGLQAATISVSKGVTAQIVISTAKGKSSAEYYFRGTGRCGPKIHFRTVTCLDLHLPGKEPIAQIPASLVDLTDEDEFAADLAKIGQSPAKKEKHGNYDWGFVSTWIANGARFFYMIPENRTYGLRVGPMDDSVFANFDFPFEQTHWEFKDE